VANYVLGSGSVSRLYIRVREEAGLAYVVGSYIAPGRYGATAVVSLQTRSNEVNRALALTRGELRRLTEEPVLPQELELAKSYLIGSFPRRLDTSAKVASFLVGVEEQGLGLDYAETFRERIARVTIDDVRRVAARYLAPDTFDLVTVGSAPPAEVR
jgi:zinc protease